MVKRFVEKLCALTGPDEKRLREYLAMLEILADNRHLALNLQETYAMLHINLERLPSYQKGLEQGMEKGREEGREEGAHRKALAVAEALLAMRGCLKTPLTPVAMAILPRQVVEDGTQF